MVNADAVAWFTVKVLLVVLDQTTRARRQLFVLPAVSMRKFVNVTVPLPAAVPISCVLVPCNVPVPDTGSCNIQVCRQTNC